jgi:hypothetical protein
VLALKLATVFFRNGSHDQQQSEQNESGSWNHWKSLKIIINDVWTAPKIMKDNTLGRFVGVLGSAWWKVRKKASSGLSFWRFLFDLVDIGRNFGSHWILEGSQNQWFSHEINIKCEKVMTRSGPRKNMNCWWKIDAKTRGSKREKWCFRTMLVAI